MAVAEDLVSNQYKMSASQWLRHKYDVKTLIDLNDDEIINGPFAQILRFEGKRNNRSLGSSSYDFYKICLQDNSILAAMDQLPGIKLFPFTLYIVVHELIHIVRFSKFKQGFEASDEEKMNEEKRVHEITRKLLESVNVEGVGNVIRFYGQWQEV